MSIGEEEARSLLARAKVVTDALEWTARPNHAGSVWCTAVVFDAQGVAIPGVTLQLEAKAPIAVDACLFHFSLFKQVHGKRLRVYQLEVAPAKKKTHNGPKGALHGPHEHFGEDVAEEVHDPSVRCGDWPAAFRWFCVRCNLTAPPIEAPC